MAFLGSPSYNILGLVTTFLAIVFLYFKWAYQYWKKRNVPYFPPKIPLGNMGNPFSISLGHEMVGIYKNAKARGWRYCGIYLGSRPVLLIVDLDLVKQVLSKDFQYFSDRGLYVNEKDEPLSCNLFSNNVAKWRKLKSKVSPAFTSDKHKDMFQTLANSGLALEEYLQENIKPGAPVDARDILACFASDSISSCAFGVDCNSFNDPNCMYRSLSKTVLTYTKPRVIKTMFIESFPRLAYKLRLRQFKKEDTEFFTKVMQDTVSYRKENDIKRKDFLQLLLDMRDAMKEEENAGPEESLTMNEIFGHSLVFFIAGFETSSATMTFVLFELAMHPEIQERVRDEIHSVLEKNDDKITYDSLSEMKYLGQVVDETMRMYAPIRMLVRRCVSDYKIPGEDIVIEKDTRILISARGIHYDEEYWENPKIFDPERFSEEKRVNIDRYTHIPFGQGPRMCMGVKFALMQMKVGLASILRNYRVKLDKKTKLPIKMSVKTPFASAEGGIWLNLERV